NVESDDVQSGIPGETSAGRQMDCRETWKRCRSVDFQLLQLVAPGAEGDAQLGGGLGLVEGVVLRRMLDGLALDCLYEVGQGVGGGFAMVDLVGVQRRGGGGLGRGGRPDFA